MNVLWIAITALVVAVGAFGRALVDHIALRRRLYLADRELSVLRQALRARAHLSNEIAHDIKNPLTAILCSAEALDLLLGGKLDDVHRNSLRYIREYGTSLLQLMNDFIDVSRAEAGVLKSNPSAVKLSDEVRSVVGLLDALASRKEVRLSTQVGETSLSAMVDRKHLKQVLFNLVHNAIKFTGNGGEVRIEITSEFPKPFVRIAVKDNGKGIPQDALPSIFDPYARYEGNQPDMDVGVGLGLALCKQLVALAGGEISVSSEVGVGSIFSVTLPAAPATATTLGKQNAALPAMQQPLHGQRVLLIEGDEGARNAVSKLIEAWGGSVDLVSEAADAVESLARGQYHAVMIDGEKDPAATSELARMIKEDLESATLVIMATSQDSSDANAAPANVDRVLPKPFDGEKLLDCLMQPRDVDSIH